MSICGFPGCKDKAEVEMTLAVTEQAGSTTGSCERRVRLCAHHYKVVRPTILGAFEHLREAW